MLVCVWEDVKDEGGAVLQVQLWTLTQLHHLKKLMVRIVMNSMVWMRMVKISICMRLKGAVLQVQLWTLAPLDSVTICVMLKIMIWKIKVTQRDNQMMG